MFPHLRLLPFLLNTLWLFFIFLHHDLLRHLIPQQTRSRFSIQPTFSIDLHQRHRFTLFYLLFHIIDITKRPHLLLHTHIDLVTSIQVTIYRLYISWHRNISRIFNIISIVSSIHSRLLSIMATHSSNMTLTSLSSLRMNSKITLSAVFWNIIHLNLLSLNCIHRLRNKRNGGMMHRNSPLKFSSRPSPLNLGHLIQSNVIIRPKQLLLRRLWGLMFLLGNPDSFFGKKIVHAW